MRVNYALFAKDRSKVFFVELKTEAGSRRDDQDLYLRKSTELGYNKSVEGVCAIVGKTAAQQKYHTSFSMLAALGYVTMPDDIRAYLSPDPRAGPGERLSRVRPTELDSKVEVLYLQPAAMKGADSVPPDERERCIDFATFATFVDRHDDPLSRVFAGHLRKWRGVAGACVPESSMPLEQAEVR